MPNGFKLSLTNIVHKADLTPIHLLGCRSVLRRVPGKSFVSASSLIKGMAFPPEKIRGIVNEVTKLLKERKENVSVAETVSFSRPCSDG
jgi:hypothetical protein